MVTAVLFVIVLVLAALNTTVVMPYTESRTGNDAFQQAYNLFTGLFVVATGVLGVVSIVKDHDRSWAVVIPVLLALAALALQIPDYLG